MKNLQTGLNNFKEQFGKDLSFEQLLKLYGNLKVLEYRTIAEHDTTTQYQVQDLIIEVEDKLKSYR